MKILITGGCGFIGTNLVANLKSIGGYEIRVIDNESLGKKANISEFDVEFQRGDITSIEDLRQALAGMDAVIHLAADTRVIDSIEKPFKNFTINVTGTLNLLMAMREAGVQTIINASTGGAILGEVPPPVCEDMVPSPQSPYGASKLAIEGYLSAFSASYNIKACSLRFSNVYGPRSWHKGSVVAAFMKNILRGESLQVFGDGEQTRDYVHVEDLCRGIIQAITSGKSGVYQLGTGCPTSINQLIATISNVTNRQLKVAYLPHRQGEILHTYCNITKAKESFGYNPHIRLENGIAETWKWFCAHKEKFI